MRNHVQSKARSLQRRKKRLEKKKSKISVNKVNNNSPNNFSKGSFTPPKDDDSIIVSHKTIKVFDTNAWKPNE